MAGRIEDYALLGDCRTAALVGRDGSIDWFCAPRFDGAACFAALLGDREHGRFALAPDARVATVTDTRRRYEPGTLVLETTVETETGAVTVVDFMPLAEHTPDDVGPTIVRIVRGRRGVVPMRLELTIRFDYGSNVPWVQRAPGGIIAIAGPDLLRLWSTVPTHGEALSTVADFEVRQGQTERFVLSYTPSHAPPRERVDPDSALETTRAWWRDWSRRCKRTGAHDELVERSLITLKALTYAPTGGIVAAPTTSLPEAIGGVRNWDYRFVWLRDAALTLFALQGAGYTEEALAFRDWLLRAAAGNPSQLRVLYGVAGERRVTEFELDWLPGYEGSKPVRIGNAAASQLQLDVYGELLGAMHLARTMGDDSETGWALQRALVEALVTIWREPDEGIWEVRGERRHFTFSKVMCWVAFDRAIRGAEQFGLRAPVERWRAERDAVAASVCEHGFDRERNAFVQSYGSQELDASCLLIPIVGFLPVDDPRVLGTIAAIERELVHEGFVHRYATRPSVDGLPPGEGTFLACTFWLADCYALLGRDADARAVFDRAAGVANDLGLLAEEYDPVAKRMLGNFPQAFSHVALVHSAMQLAKHEARAPVAGPTATDDDPLDEA